MTKEGKIFRIIQIEQYGLFWQVEEQRSLFFGLIKYWKRSKEFYLHCTIPTATRAIIEKYPTGKLLILKGNGVIHFMRNS